MCQKRIVQQKAIWATLYAARMIEALCRIDQRLFDGMIDIFRLIKKK